MSGGEVVPILSAAGSWWGILGKINLGDYQLFPEGALLLCPQLLLVFISSEQVFGNPFKLFISQAPGFLGLSI